MFECDLHPLTHSYSCHRLVVTPQSPKVVEALVNESVVDIACGPLTTAAVTADGKLFLWGAKLDCGRPSFEPTPFSAFEVNTFRPYIGFE